MAYQPKSYRKFVATAATATLVASAVAPAAAAGFTDVSDNYKEAVDFVVSKGAKGLTETRFGVSENIKRVDAAVLLANVLELDTEGAPAAGFTDVPARARGAVNALKAAGITNGKSDTKFGADDLITRGELAIWIQKGFGLEGTADFKFTDVGSRYTEAVAALVANKITQGKSETQFGTADNAKRGDYAIFLHRADQAQPATPEVVGVSATNGKTLTVTGAKLNTLKAEDISLANNEVENISVSNDGKTATVTFKHSFTPDTEYSVTFKLESGDKTFKFVHSIGEVKSVELDVRTYDDDTANQLLTFKVNGETTAADTEWLRQAGYTVNFVAVNENNAAASIFAGGNSTSSTGLLANEIPIGKYTVEIQIVKDGTVVVSDRKVITVADLESTTTAISSVQLTNVAGFVHNSKTLVTGETADITRIVGNAAGKSNVSLPVGLAEVSSSNPAVVSVSGDELKANVEGKATITVKIGEATHSFEITVAKANRTITKVTPSEATVKLVQGSTRTIQVTTVDQYGDPIAVNANSVIEDLPLNASNQPLISINDADSTATELITGANGKTVAGFEISASATETGNGTLIFKDENGKNVGQVGIQVSNVNNVASTKVEYTVASDKTTNNIETGDVNQYQVSKFNSNGFYNGVETLNLGPATAGQLTVSSADESIATVTLSGSATAFNVNPVKAGKTDIVITDENGLVKHKFTVVISSAPVVITKVNFKSVSTIDYVGKTVEVDDVLDVRPDTGKNRIVYGVEHNANTIAKVRIDESNPSAPFLYIDTDTATTDGGYDAGTDILLGAVTGEVLTGSSGASIADGSIDIAPGDYTTASTDKGTVLFRVITPEISSAGVVSYPVNNTIATTVLNINVK